VAIEDAIIDHRFAYDAQTEHLAMTADQHAIDSHGIGGILDREDRLARGNATQDRHLGRVIARDDLHHAGAQRSSAQRYDLAAAVGQHGPHRARLEIFATQVALLLERL